MLTRTVPALILATTLLLVGCPSPNNGSSTTSPASTTTRVIGTTTYSADGGTTVSDAAFAFDVPNDAVAKTLSRATGDTSEWVPITGQLRAGDILLTLSGSYNSRTKVFTLTAVGTVLTTRISITVSGTHVPASNTLTGGSTSVAVTTNYGTNNAATTTYSSTKLTTGDSATKPVTGASTAPAVTTATPVPAANKKFWEGTWAVSFRQYYVSPTSGTVSPSNAATAYWMDFAFNVTLTAVQFNSTWTGIPCAALATAGWANSGETDSEAFASTVTESATVWDGYLKCTAYSYFGTGITPNTVGNFGRTIATLNSDGTLWGRAYQVTSGQTTTKTYASLSAAQTALGGLTTATGGMAPPTGINGMTKIN